MDLLRRAVGDEKMTFAGYSYGSYIGSTYANMFPNKVRAVIIDGVIDPVSYATGRGNEAKYLPIDARLVSEQGAYESLQEFLRLCDPGGATCAFSDGNPKRRYDALAQRLIAEPAATARRRGRHRSLHLRRPGRHHARRDVRRGQVAGPRRVPPGTRHADARPGRPRR